MYIILYIIGSKIIRYVYTFLSPVTVESTWAASGSPDRKQNNKICIYFFITCDIREHLGSLGLPRVLLVDAEMLNRMLRCQTGCKHHSGGSDVIKGKARVETGCKHHGSRKSALEPKRLQKI